MGDELSWDVPARHVANVFGHNPTANMTFDQVIALAQERHEAFHIVVAQGSHGRNPKVLEWW
ncbi:MAG: hypothetical protein AAFS10_26040, partial [Myxococcota bacterium]